MEIVVSKQNYTTSDQMYQCMKDEIEVAQKLKSMALDSDELLTFQDKMEALKLAASCNKNAIDAAKSIIMNDTLQHRIFHDNKHLID